MKIAFYFQIASLMISLLGISSCKKESIEPVESTFTSQEIISSISTNINYSTYLELQNLAIDLHTKSVAFSTNPTDNLLQECRSLWKSARGAWEQSEGFIYGPVSTENIDPRIDTWPVNFVDLNAEINSGNPFTDTYVSNLEDALKGFHPIEFLLWGQNGTKSASDFTPRELEYLVALTKDLENLTSELAEEWNQNTANSYIHFFTNPTISNPYYESKKAVFQEIVNAMIGICDEVASGKIGEPFIQGDPSLEESPYSQNSMTDFKNNLKSVQNIYLGKFNTDGIGLEDLVRKYNLSLDNTIKTEMNNAIASLDAITDPFGTAIISQPTQIQNAISAIEALKTTLEDKMIPFVNQYITD
jgi:putative iron-regulated protein